MMKLAKMMVLAVLVATASPAHAVIGVMDNVPAGTLLLPYFEQGLDDPNAVSTTFTIGAATPTSLMAHVTLWTDLGVPTHSFNIYLTGMDIQTVDLRALFQVGVIEPTASAGQDPANLISPKGPMSQDINFASCGGILPAPRLTAAQLDHLRRAHTGRPSPAWDGKCGGSAQTDGVARGFITVDLVNSCTSQMPGDPGYFENIITWQNLLMGHYELINRRAGVAHSASMVAIEASYEHPLTAPGNLTFYGWRNGWTGVDRREALPNVWQTRFIKGGNPAIYGGLASGTTHLAVWRDPGQAVVPFTCGALPAVFPQANGPMVAFNEEEEPLELSGHLFPITAQRVDVGSSAMALAFDSGFLTLNLNNPAAAEGPTMGKMARQSFVTTMLSASAAGYSVAFPAAPVSSAAHGSLVVSEPSGVTSTDGSAFMFTVLLSIPPTASVTLPVESTVPGMGTVSPASVELNDGSPAFIWVTGVPDPNTAAGYYAVKLGPAVSTDPRYNGLGPILLPMVHRNPNVIEVSPLSVNTTRTGGEATFTISLKRNPVFGLDEPAQVQVNLVSSDPRQGTITPQVVQLYSTYSPITVRVKGADDGDPNTEDVTYTIRTMPILSADPFFRGIDPPDVTVTNQQ